VAAFAQKVMAFSSSYPKVLDMGSCTAHGQCRPCHISTGSTLRMTNSIPEDRNMNRQKSESEMEMNMQ
jgi:hypothetical protein